MNICHKNMIVLYIKIYLFLYMYTRLLMYLHIIHVQINAMLLYLYGLSPSGPNQETPAFAQVNVSNYPCAAGWATDPSNPHNVFSFPYPPVPGTWRGGPYTGGPRGHGDPLGALLLWAGWQLPSPAGTFTSWLWAGPWQELFSAVNGPINKELSVFVLPLGCQGPL